MTMKTAQQLGRIAVLYGGNSGEREVSLRSGKAVFDALIRQGVNAELIDTKETEVLSLKAAGYSRAFNMVHGRGGEDGQLQGALESIGMPYTGSGILGSAIGMDKRRSKMIWQAAGLPTIEGKVVVEGESLTIESAQSVLNELGNKVMVKPAQEGSSLGMAIVEKVDELLEAVEKAKAYPGDVLIERYISGNEYTASVLNGEALPVVRIQPAREFYDYTAKYTESGTQYFCPAGLSDEDEKFMRAMALKAFAMLGCSGWGRVDFIHDSQRDQFLLLEANTVPGMTESSLVPMAAKAAGLSFDELVMSIISALEGTAHG